MANLKTSVNVSDFPKMTVAQAADFLDVSVQSIYQRLKSKSLSCPKIGSKSYITHDIARELFSLDFNRRVVVGEIVKGGTGKTTTIINVGCCANAYGAKVLLVDIDPQGNLTDAFDVDADENPVIIDVIKKEAKIRDCIVSIAPGLDIIPSRIENVILDNEIVIGRYPLDKFYQNLLGEVKKEYDFIFFDCPPTMGQSVTAASLFADIILAPLNPDKFSAKGLKILKQEIDTLNHNFNKNIDYKVYLNKFSSKTILSDKAVMALLSDPELEGRVLGTTVQFTQEVPNITDQNKNLFTSITRTSVRADFDLLTRELLGINPGNYSQDASSDTRASVMDKEPEHAAA